VSRKNKDIEIHDKLATQGNFDEAQKQLERLKTGQEDASKSSVTSFGKMQGAWKAWTSAAMTSAGAMRKAWLTALGPIGALIVIITTLKSMFGFVFTAVQKYKKAQEETNKTVGEASTALERATHHKNKYADAQTIVALSAAIKAHQSDLEAISKKNEEITKKVEGAGQQWWNVFRVVSANNRALIDKLPLLAQAQIEAQKEVRAKEEALEVTKQQEEAEKKRLAALDRVQLRIKELTLSETEFKKVELGRQLDEYTKAGVSSIEIERLRGLELEKINKEASDKILREKEKEKQAIEQLAVELDHKIAALGEETLQKKQAMLAAEMDLERNKILATTKGEENRQKLLEKLQVVEFKRNQAMTKAEIKMKTEAALQIADISIQALSTLNSMAELKSKEDARRAKFLLALEKAIAIARVWSAEASKGALGVGIAAATTGLIVAQFAQQSKAIDDARAASAAGAQQFTVSTPLPGGSSLDGTVQGGGAPSSGGGFSSGSSGGGGGGGITVIQYINVQVSVSPQNLDLSERRVVLRALAEEMRGTASEEARNFALTVQNLANRNAGMAA
jgi:hypothetical protein